MNYSKWSSRIKSEIDKIEAERSINRKFLASYEATENKKLALNMSLRQIELSRELKRIYPLYYRVLSKVPVVAPKTKRYTYKATPNEEIAINNFREDKRFKFTE
jgi:hypothetical protein